ncbi:polysaccharide deacetylase family protein [Bacillus aerolatus]|uniref:Polysaccharide deacetylase family protein n=1 Tax=Bacillus aerolatus TaxID=2653354 RepID=A0A6I1FBP9_9BACI|nr:polysaccharide deacetylase family protein [Bacillus aerolatus]KAB7704647.1 polysaccharide deacetylase family protein [Bacillus aerolatus]
MTFFYTLHAKKTKQVLLLVSVSFFTALLLFTQNSLGIPVFSEKDSPKAIYKGEKGVALTFDIGWGDEKAAQIVQTLIRHKAKATFFLSGSWAERHPDLVKKMKEHHFEIGLLGYNYVDYTSMTKEEIKKDVLKAQEVFNKLQIEQIKLLRAPTGHFNQEALQVAEDMNLTYVHWSIDTNDWKNPGKSFILSKAKEARNGDILFMHASDSAKQTNAVLPDVIEASRSAGKLVTVSELIANGKVETKPIP